MKINGFYTSLRSLAFLLTFLLNALTVLAGSPFVKNEGQWEEGIAYGLYSSSCNVSLERDGLYFQLFDIETLTEEHLKGIPPEDMSRQSFRWKIVFEGINAVEPEGLEEGVTRYHFYLGNDPAQWRTDVRSYEKVIYQDLWDGIDLLVYRNEDGLKYDFIVKPGADPNVIRWHYEGVDGAIREDGSISYETAFHEVVESAPFTYQLEGSALKEIGSRYIRAGASFQVKIEDYDKNGQLVIDPEVVWSSYLDPKLVHVQTINFEDQIFTINDVAALFGSQGGGVGLYDEVSGVSGIASFDNQGAQVNWVSVVGGSEDTDTHHVNIHPEEGKIIVLASTEAQDFPTTEGAVQNTADLEENTVLYTLSTQGNQLMASTFINLKDETEQRLSKHRSFFTPIEDENIYYPGGPSAGISSMAVSNGFIFTWNSTGSIEEGVLNNAYGLDEQSNILSFSIDIDLSTINWITTIGRGAEINNELLSEYSLVNHNDSLLFGLHFMDACVFEGREYLVGWTACSLPYLSEDAFQPDFSGPSQGFVLGLDLLSGELEYASYFGGAGNDEVWGIRSTPEGKLGLIGRSDSELLIQAAEYTMGDGLVFYLEWEHETNVFDNLYRYGVSETTTKNDDLLPNAFTYDQCGNLIIGIEGEFGVHITQLDEFKYLPSTGVNANWFEPEGSTIWLKMNRSDDNLLRIGYRGGTVTHSHIHKPQASDDLFFGICVHSPELSEGEHYIPTTAGVMVEDYIISSNTNISHLNFSSGQSGFVTALGEATLSEVDCSGGEVTFNGSGGSFYQWNFGDGSEQLSTETDVNHQYEAPGSYTVQLTVTDSTTCNISETIELEITIPDLPSPMTAEFTAEDFDPCAGPQNYSAEVVTTEADQLVWTLPTGDTIEGDPSLEYFIDTPGSYIITLEVSHLACDTSVTFVSEVELYEERSAVLNLELFDPGICEPFELEVSTQSTGIDSYTWYLNDAEISTEEEVYLYLEEGSYELEASFYNAACDETLTIVEEVVVPALAGEAELIVPNIFSPQNDGVNDYYYLSGNIDEALIVSFSFKVFNRWGEEVYSTENPTFRWDGRREGDPLSPGNYFYTLRYQLSCEEEFRIEQGEVMVVR